MAIHGLMFLGGAAVIGWAALEVRAWPHLTFLAMLAIALPASRLKLKLPGFNGNMSVNLPFILLAALTLSAFEALMLGAVSAAVQSLPRDGNKIKPIQVIFNVSTMAIAVGLALLLGVSVALRKAGPRSPGGFSVIRCEWL